MFAPSHMAVGALTQAGLKRKLPTAIVAFASMPLLDSSRLWHALSPWPEDSPVVFHIIPYPHDVASILTIIALIVATVTVGVLLRRYWWGMLWAVSPDIIDWIILRPILGYGPIHELFAKVSTPWGFGLEMSFVAIIVYVLLKRDKAKASDVSTDASQQCAREFHISVRHAPRRWRS